ncbi:5'-nucleotidase, lipoprotein e(P4) family [Polaribacter cellanae]|uniref:5'-nucleotidase, lipoprotein e(P4) family n=1 Tax=Polaribacter cellanae TaxID=2818493 RepID=A0A975H798_9FLAO|nr:5'-nucleotidase, lipoprotein e(P4) family [Polaribacter cellanae]QTE22843.1 5'-nucleotidase, lipoprotein e(P4) family [Polaribacter cellanae]
MRINKKIINLLVCVITIISCKTLPTKHNVLKTPIQEHSVKAVLWQQLSGEYKALAYQAFLLAKIQLDNAIQSSKNNGKPFAIVTDIDETVLDNSPYFAKMIKLDKNFSKKMWKDWGLLEKAAPVPGALEFFQYAASKNVAVFYISNRNENQLEETVKNLKKLGFPFANKEHTFLKKQTSSKEDRRKKVLKAHNIVMLLGDNLSDFTSAFERKSTKDRNNIVKIMKTEFGKKFIVLPNPIYGDWENHGLYSGKYTWSPTQRDSIRKSKLISY